MLTLRKAYDVPNHYLTVIFGQEYRYTDEEADEVNRIIADVLPDDVAWIGDELYVTTDSRYTDVEISDAFIYGCSIAFESVTERTHNMVFNMLPSWILEQDY